MQPDDQVAVTWRDAELWADHADDHGVDCPVCSVSLGNLSTLGEVVRRVQDHMAEAHAPIIEGPDRRGRSTMQPDDPMAMILVHAYAGDKAGRVGGVRLSCRCGKWTALYPTQEPGYTLDVYEGGPVAPLVGLITAAHDHVWWHHTHIVTGKAVVSRET
jgi:hypothetical protein